MYRFVLVQSGVTLMAAALVAFGVAVFSNASAMAGVHAGLSVILGGAACVVPNLLFMIRLMTRSGPMGTANAPSAAGFLLGEFLKLGLTVALLFVIVRLYPELNWLAFIVGVVVSLKSYLVFLLIDRWI